MSNCSNCGEPLRDGAKFCAKCGQPVSLNTSSEVKNEATNSVVQASGEKSDENSGGGCGCLIIILIAIIYKFFF